MPVGASFRQRRRNVGEEHWRARTIARVRGVAHPDLVAKYEITNARYSMSFNARLPQGIAADHFGLYNPKMMPFKFNGIAYHAQAQDGAKFRVKPNVASNRLGGATNCAVSPFHLHACCSMGR